MKTLYVVELFAKIVEEMINYVFSATFFLITSAIITARNFTPASRGCKIVCKRGLFFDYG